MSPSVINRTVLSAQRDRDVLASGHVFEKSRKYGEDNTPYMVRSGHGRYLIENNIVLMNWVYVLFFSDFCLKYVIMYRIERAILLEIEINIYYFR